MNSYALSSCLLEETKNNKKIITSILHKISDENTPYKVVVDRKGVIIDLYEKIANNDNVHVASWLRILTRDPKQIEYLDINFEPDSSEIIKFIETAIQIRNEKKLIVNSHNSLPTDINYCESNTINYKDNIVKILNNNEAMTELNKNNGITINNENNLNSKNKEIKDSFVADNNSNIEGSTFNNKTKKKTFLQENIIVVIVLGVIASLIAAWIWSKM